MARAFEALRGAADAKQRIEIVKAQVRWIAERDSACGDKSGAALGACLADQSRQRTSFLNGAPEAGPGAPGKLTPYFRIEKGGKGRTDVDIEVFKFVSPSSAAERAFNAAVEKLTSDVPQPDKDEPASDFSYSVTMTIAYASPKLISANAVTSTYLGGAHPNNSSDNINLDVAAARETTFDNLIDKAAAQKIFSLCAKQVEDQKREAEGADADLGADVLKSLRETVVSVTGDLKLWSFGADKATIGYDADVVGAHTEGVFDCTIPYSTLRPLAKPGFPLP
jgi:hypothetical protein